MDLKTVAIALYEPFELNEIKCKPQTVKGNRALAVFYIDSRLVMDRLDDVLGVMGWRDHYEVQPDGSVVCTLSLKLGEEWISKTDVGSPSEQPDSGDRLKAAFSDALKRAAVKFGIGRYLYRLPLTWADYDTVKRAFVTQPRLPDWAKPVRSIDRKQPSPYANYDAEPLPLTVAPPQAPAALTPAAANKPVPKTPAEIAAGMQKATPRDSLELFKFCEYADGQLRSSGCNQHDVLGHVGKTYGLLPEELHFIKAELVPDAWKQACEYVGRIAAGAA